LVAELKASRLERSADLFVRLASLRQITLADGHEHRPFQQAGVESPQLGHESVEVSDGVAFRVRVHTQHVKEHLSSLDVFEEPEAQTSAFGCPLDNPRDVRDDKCSVDAERHDAQVRDQRRKRVVGDLGARTGNRRDESTLADVWEAHDANVCEELEDEPDLLTLARRAGLGAARGAVIGRRELDIPTPAFATLGDDELGARLMEVGEQGVALLVVDLGAYGDLDPYVPACLAELVLAPAILAALGANDPAVAKIEQRGESIVCHQDDAPSASSIASRGAAERDELLSSKRDGTVPTVAGGDLQRYFIDEIHARPYVGLFAGATDLVLEQIGGTRTLRKC
jgi:hypothetical protein